MKTFFALCAILPALGIALESAVTIISSSTFDAVVKGTPKTWLVEFYAPWCGHCKKLLPRFEEAAKQIGSGKNELIRLAKADCEVETDLKKRFKIDGFPTILYFVDGNPDVPHEYRGPKTTEGMVSFAKRISRPHVTALSATGSTVGSTFDLQEWARKEGGIVYVLVTGSSPKGALETAFSAAASTLRDTLAFATVSESDASGIEGIKKHLTPGSERAVPPAPYVARIEAGSSHVEYLTASALADKSGRPKAYASRIRLKATKVGSRSDPLFGLKDGSPESALASWVLHWRYPLVSALGPDNFASIAQNEEGREVVIAVIDEDDAEHSDGNASRASAAFLRAVRRLASPSTTSLRTAALDRFVFGWLDAVKFSSFTEQFGLKQGDSPRLLVVDPPRQMFWYDHTVDEEDEIDTWLTEIGAGRAPMQRQGMLALPQKLLNALGIYGAVAVGVLILGVLGWIIWVLVVAEACGWNEAARVKAARAVADKKASKKGAGQVQTNLHDESVPQVRLEKAQARPAMTVVERSVDSTPAAPTALEDTADLARAAFKEEFNAAKSAAEEMGNEPSWSAVDADVQEDKEDIDPMSLMARSQPQVREEGRSSGVNQGQAPRRRRAD